MKNQFKKLFPVISILTLVIALASFVSVQSKIFKDINGVSNVSQTLEDKYAAIQRGIAVILSEGHLSPKPFDNNTSKEIYKEFISTLDYNKHFFTQSDMKVLEVYEERIDDEILLGRHQFFNVVDSLIVVRIDDCSSIYEDLLEKPFDYEKEESIELDHEKMTFPSDKNEQIQEWRKYLKYQTLSKLIDLEEAEEKNDSTPKKSFDELEALAREKVKKSQDNWFRRLKQLNTDDRFSFYINSITAVFDPHTTYLPPKDKENFDIRFSGKLEGIGAVLRETDGAIKVDRIVTGSASWKQGELKVGDVITKVAQGTDDPVDIQGMPLDDAVKLIRGPKGSEVRLTVKSKDGRSKVIPIIRDIVVLAETYAKSATITKGKKTYGIINLPHFYADFNDRNGRNCFDDMAKEVEKLKNAKVDGIIIDLRDNGGGSLAHVIEMVGLFVGKGPVVQVREKSVREVKSSSTDIQYDGPLAVMINSNSASASEIFAAALQDYNRAVIIGGNSSFGKGTVQSFVDLDQIFGRAYPQFKPLGHTKLTIQKFYRINGGSTQLLGVIPDVKLHDNYEFMDYGEKEYVYALVHDSIVSANYSESKYGPKNMSKIQANSTARMNDSETFHLIEENAQRIKNLNDETSFSLNIKKYKSYLDKTEKDAEKYEDIYKNNEELSLSLLEVDKTEIEADEVKLEKSKNWFKALQKDPYISETISILLDWK